MLGFGSKNTKERTIGCFFSMVATVRQRTKCKTRCKGGSMGRNSCCCIPHRHSVLRQGEHEKLFWQQVTSSVCVCFHLVRGQPWRPNPEPISLPWERAVPMTSHILESLFARGNHFREFPKITKQILSTATRLVCRSSCCNYFKIRFSFGKKVNQWTCSNNC